MLGKLHVHLGSSFSQWNNCRSGGSSLVECCAGPGEEQCGQKEATLLTLLLWFFSFFVIKQGYFSSTLGSGIFKIVSCLWIVSGWSSCEGD